jgi:hypothetical protein
VTATARVRKEEAEDGDGLEEMLGVDGKAGSSGDKVAVGPASDFLPHRHLARPERDAFAMFRKQTLTFVDAGQFVLVVGRF